MCLGLLAFANVFDNADVILRRTGIVARQRLGAAHPDYRSIFAQVALVLREMVDSAGTQQAALFAPYADVVGMVEKPRRPADELLRRITDDLAITPVDLDVAVLKIKMGDADRGLIERGAEALLALLHRRLRFFELCNVLQNDRGADNVAGAVFDRGMTGQHRDHPAILGHAIGLACHHRAAEQAFVVLRQVG